jgi:hypothetical protein
MPVGLEIEGADKLRIVTRALKQFGDKDLSRGVYRGLNRATIPLRADARRSAATVLPQRGGLADRVAKSRMTTRRRAGRNPGISIQAKGMPQLRAMDRGVVRHPVYGRGPWVTQRITPGWFTDPMEAGAAGVRRELLRVLDEAARELIRKIR